MQAEIRQMQVRTYAYHWSQFVVVWLQHKILILNYSVNQ